MMSVSNVRIGTATAVAGMRDDDSSIARDI